MFLKVIFWGVLQGVQTNYRHRVNFLRKIAGIPHESITLQNLYEWDGFSVTQGHHNRWVFSQVLEGLGCLQCTLHTVDGRNPAKVDILHFISPGIKQLWCIFWVQKMEPKTETFQR